MHWLLVAQLIAVLGVCFNHLSITLLKVSPPVFSPAVYAYPALWGANFLFLSSGFLVHWRRDELMPPGTSWLSNTASYLTSRFWLLAIPCYAAYLFDVNVISFRDFGPSKNLALAAPSLLTLSQTWVHTAIGDTSLGQPLNGANMAWLGSCLLFTSIFYAVTRSLWARMSGPVAIGVLAMALALHAAQYWALDRYTGELAAYDKANFDWKSSSYGLFAYFFDFSPYTYLASLIAGVALAEMWRRRLLNKRPVQIGIAVAAIAMIAAGAMLPVQYLGVNVLLITALALLADRAVNATDPAPDTSQSPQSWRGRLAVLPQSAYTLWTLHLVMMLPFTTAALIYSFPAGKLYLAGRVVIVTLMMLMLCSGLQMYVFEPLRRAILTRLGVEVRNDRFI